MAEIAKIQLDESVIALAWSAAVGLAVGTADGQIKLLDAQKFEISAQVIAHMLGLSVLVGDPQGELLLSGGQEPIVKAWDSKTLKACFQYSFENKGWVEQVTWSDDGRYFAAAAAKDFAIFRRDGSVQRTYEALPHTIAALEFRRDEPELAVASYGGVRTFRPEGSRPKRNFAWKGSILKAKWSPDGKFLACGTQENSLHCWVVEKVKEFSMNGFPTKVREVSWHHSAKALAVGGGAAITVWDFRNGPPLGKQPVVLEGHADLISCLEFSHNGDALASAAIDGSVLYWSPELEQPKVIYNAKSPATALAWSLDDKALAVGFQDGTLVNLFPA